MVELSLVGGKSKRERKKYDKVQLGRWRLAIRRKKCHSKGTAVVQEVTQRECASAHGFVFQGKAGDESRDIREGTEMPG